MLNYISCYILSTSLLKGFRKHQKSNRNDQRTAGSDQKNERISMEEKKKMMYKRRSESIKHKLVKNSSMFFFS